MKINENSISKLKNQPPSSGNIITWDSELKYFGLRVTAKGAISFVIDYRLYGRQRRYTIGRWPEMTATAARNEAVKLREQIRAGRDPMEERKQLRQEREQPSNEPTVNDLLDNYLASAALGKKRPSTLRDYKRMIETIIRPQLGMLQLKAVRKNDIEILHVALKETPYQANRVLAMLSVLFSYAMQEERAWVNKNPVIEVERYHEEKRERYLSEDEITRFHQALEDYVNRHYGTRYEPDAQNAVNALRLLLLTGSRAGEVLKATWEQFDFECGKWIKPSAHTKQKRVERLSLNDEALALLRGMNPHNAQGPLFMGRDGTKARVGIRRPWIAACKAAGLVEVVEVEGKRKPRNVNPRMVKRYTPTVRLHDLRHTFASHLASQGVPLQRIGKLLGHTQIATTQRYAHHMDKDERDATNAVGPILAGKRDR